GPEPKGGDDEFAKAFGGGGDDKPAKKEKVVEKSSEGEKKRDVYIPPPPGAAAAEGKDTLGQADILEVGKSNLPGIQNCLTEQRKKEPGTSGKLVMRWTILTSGKTAKVEVVSEEFKQTYLAGCMGGLVKTWTFPKSKNQADPVVFPFKF